MLTNSEGEIVQEGDLLRLPKLADTLERIAEDPFSFYNGSLAEDIVEDVKEQGVRYSMLSFVISPAKICIGDKCPSKNFRGQILWWIQGGPVGPASLNPCKTHLRCTSLLRVDRRQRPRSVP